jgi:hypothetical protein
MKPVLAFVAVMVALSVGAGMVFSLHYWGYAWSLPAIDSRAAEAHWAAISGFKSNLSGSDWTLDERDVRRDEDPTTDSDCCSVSRIVKVAATSDFSALTQQDVAALQAEAMSLIQLESGEPRYAGAKRLYGVLALGTNAQGEPIAFASFHGGEVSNDHYAMYEVLWQRDTPPRLLSSRKYFGDVAGIEGLAARDVAAVLFVPIGALALLFVQLWRARESALSRRTG